MHVCEKINAKSRAISVDKRSHGLIQTLFNAQHRESIPISGIKICAVRPKEITTFDDLFSRATTR